MLILRMVIALVLTLCGPQCVHRRGRDPIVLLGLLLALISYFLTFLAIPNLANMGETRMEAFIKPNSVLIVFIAFLIGFSDACFITQVRRIKHSPNIFLLEDHIFPGRCVQGGVFHSICNLQVLYLIISAINATISITISNQCNAAITSNIISITRLMQSLFAATAFFYSPHLR